MRRYQLRITTISRGKKESKQQYFLPPEGRKCVMDWENRVSTPTKVLVYCSNSSEWWAWNLMLEFFITKIFLLAMDEDKDKLCHWDLHVTQASCCSIKAFNLNDMAILIRYEQRNSWNKRKSILQYHLFIKFTCPIYFFFQLPLDKVI